MTSTGPSDASPLNAAVTSMSTAPPGHRQSAPEANESLHEVSLPGLTLTVRSGPPADPGLPPALFVHGLGGSSSNWSVLLRDLADTVRGQALDLPGFGHSPPPDDSDYSVDGQARAVIAFLDAFAGGPVHLFGNSLGGAVTTTVAATRPDLVSTLTLISPALPELPPQHTALPTALLGLPGAPALFARATRDWPAVRRIRGIAELCYGDPERVSEEELAQAAEEYQRRVGLPYFWDVMGRSARGVVAAYTAAGPRSLWRRAQRVTAPVLLVYGVRDKLVSYRTARRACAAFPDARLLVLPDGGHVAMMEHPDAVSRAFRELLGARSHPQATSDRS